MGPQQNQKPRVKHKQNRTNWLIGAAMLGAIASFFILGNSSAYGPLALCILPVGGLLMLYLSQRSKLTGLQNEITTANAARAEAETAALEKTRVLATMSHEIRTPLNGVIGMLALLNDSHLTPQQRNYAETAHSSARTLLSIIDEVLDTARSESRRKEAQEPIDVVSFVEGITELLAPRAHTKGIEVSARVSPEVPKDLILDELHLRQVLFNLAGNAIKFTEKGGVAIEVNMAANNMVLIKVRDSGIGMTKEEAAKVFDAYTQASETTRARFGGTGLGLSISRDLVAGMGGSLSLDTAPGKGSTFIIELPVTAPTVTPSAAAVQNWQPLTRRHYVLALPEGFAREHLASALAELGADVSYVDNAKDLNAELVTATPLRQFICGTQYAESLRKWAKKHKSTSQAVVWVMLKPEERHNHDKLLHAPFAGYLLSPLRRSTLLAQLSSHDGRSLKQTGLALVAGKKSTTAKTKPPSGLTILLAEDNAINALLTRTILERGGHQVRVVGDGGEALDLMRSDWHCDLAIMDVEMPWVSGIKVAELIRKDEGLQHRRNLPLLAMTGNVRPEDVRACLDAGFNEHLPKPFDRLDLEDKVAHLIMQVKAA